MEWWREVVAETLESFGLSQDLCLHFCCCTFCCLWAVVFNCTVPLTWASTSRRAGVRMMTSPRRELVLTEQANMSVEKVWLYSSFDEKEFICHLKFSGEWLLSNLWFWKMKAGRRDSWWWRCDPRVVWPVLAEQWWASLLRSEEVGELWRTAVTATLCSGISLSSLCCGRRWAGRHGGVVEWTMIILDVEERWTRQDVGFWWMVILISSEWSLSNGDNDMKSMMRWVEADVARR